MSDKRSVATDALATLGTIIDDTQKRDAIHIAVEPVVAGERLHPGCHITVIDGVAWASSPDDPPEPGEEPLGIVDPFLTRNVKKGQRFWFLMYPRMVTSLRHVWAHPAFPDEVGTPAPAVERVADDKAASEKWLRDFCDRSDCPGYETVIAAVLDQADEEYVHFDGRDAHGEIPSEFWHHAEIVLGRKFEHHPTYFSCSC